MKWKPRENCLETISAYDGLRSVFFLETLIFHYIGALAKEPIQTQVEDDEICLCDRPRRAYFDEMRGELWYRLKIHEPEDLDRGTIFGSVSCPGFVACT